MSLNYWLHIKNSEDAGPPMIYESAGDRIPALNLQEVFGSRELEITSTGGRFEFIDTSQIAQNRRLHRVKGRIQTVTDDGSVVSKNIVVDMHFEKLEPTQTSLSEEEIESFTFNLKWRTEKKLLGFNTPLIGGATLEHFRQLKIEPSQAKLKSFNGTLFLAFTNNFCLERLFPIRRVDRNEITLSGFIGEPYEVTCTILKK